MSISKAVLLSNSEMDPYPLPNDSAALTSEVPTLSFLCGGEGGTGDEEAGGSGG